MRFVTFSFLKNSRLKTLCHHLSRHLSASAAAGPAQLEKPIAGDPSLVEIADSWAQDEAPELRAAVLRDMQVFPEFVSEGEEAALLAELEPYLKRMRYEFDHWDNAIQGYRETERSAWSPANEAVLRRLRARAFAPAARLLPATHVLDLAPAGHIRPHLDAVRFCGDVIAGLCLCSAAVMRLQHAEPHAHRRLHALLQRRALYVMRGTARYEFKHAVLGGADSAWRGQRVPRARRVALIAREQPAQHSSAETLAREHATQDNSSETLARGDKPTSSHM